ncbi:MAG: Lrp/AsnC family transcriptional regulator [Promethearchaeota archaeon]|nr:MAG: Lrp/AsnC family transcriptional regulator [Candidatus Lokiarchaeota archaeon]
MRSLDLLTTRKLVKGLTKNTKPTISNISHNLNTTRQTINSYIDKLRNDKIINHHTISINPSPNQDHVIMEIKTNPQEPHLVKNLLNLPQLKMLDGIFGEFSLIALFIFESQKEFTKTLSKVDSIMSESYFKKYQFIETIKTYKINGIDLSKIELKDYKLDEMDLAILEILQSKQKYKILSTYDITRLLEKLYSIEITQPTTYNRIKRMEESGIILNYTIQFCPRKLGFNGKFIIRIKPKNPSSYNELALELVEMKEITHLYRIGEQFGLFGIVRTKEIRDYAHFIELLYKTGEIEDTFTNFVLDERLPFTNFKI